jgi:iron only hydrogenase large subunit-like protein
MRQDDAPGKAGLKNGMLLEGMACKHGCIGGPGTVVAAARARKSVAGFARNLRTSHGGQPKHQ